VRSVDPHFAIGANQKERSQGGATRAHDEFPDPLLHVTTTVRVQRREALIIVIMTTQHHIYTVRVENSPERIQAWIIAMSARTESGMMEEG
jgi:hypothetical protein